MSKTLTIVIPTYNMEAFLHRCLDSLVIEDETLFDKLEVLVINDGSKDSSSTIAHDFQNKYPNVFHVIDKENGNYGSCINRGLKEAKGKYVKILDADDYFNLLEFEKFLKQLEEIDADIVVSDYNMVNLNGRIIRKMEYNIPKGKLSIINAYLTNPSFGILQMHAISYKTSMLVECGYKQTEGISYTDQEWMFYPMAFATTFCYLKNNVYQYVLGREGQTMSSSFAKRAIPNIEIILHRQLLYIKTINKETQLYVYLRNRAFRLVNFAYPILLLDKNYSLLNEIDNMIRKISIIIYDDMESIKLNDRIFPFKYIGLYRRGSYGKLKSLMLGYNTVMRLKKMFTGF